jgi:hypothetical protein
LEFSTVVAYLPKDEIVDLPQKMEAAKTADAETHPDATHKLFSAATPTLSFTMLSNKQKSKDAPPSPPLTKAERTKWYEKQRGRCENFKEESKRRSPCKPTYTAVT